MRFDKPAEVDPPVSPGGGVVRNDHLGRPARNGVHEAFLVGKNSRMGNVFSELPVIEVPGILRAALRWPGSLAPAERREQQYD